VFYDGTNDEIRTSIGSCNLTGAITMVVVARRNSTAYNALIGIHTSGGTPTYSLEVEDNGTGNRWDFCGDTASGGLTWVNADGWTLLCISKSAGTVTPRGHKYVYSTDSWTHANWATTEGDKGSAAGGTVRFGEWQDVDDFAGDLAAAAIFDRALTDAEVELLAHSLNNWHALAPVGFWIFDQGAVSMPLQDMTGNGANESAITGTAVATSAPSLSYGAPIRRVTKQPAGGAPVEVVLAGAQPAASGRLRVSALRLKGDQPAPSGALTSRRLFTQIALTGSQPAATGTARSLQYKALAGAQGAPAGALTPDEILQHVTLTGAGGSPAGAVSSLQSADVAGEQGAPSGALTNKTMAKRLSGAQGEPSGVLAIQQSLQRLLAGAQGEPAGDLSAQQASDVALSGSQGAPSGSLVAKFAAKMVAGAQGAPAGVLTPDEILQHIGLAGSQGAPSGGISTESLVYVNLAGAQGAPAGVLTNKTLVKMLAGSQGTPAGALHFKGFVTLAGAQGAPSGALTFKAIAVFLAGAQGSPSGVLLKRLYVTLAGSQGAPAGALRHTDLILLTGSQPGASGTLTADHNPAPPAVAMFVVRDEAVYVFELADAAVNEMTVSDAPVYVFHLHDSP
jgi:hypothetical protein